MWLDYRNKYQVEEGILEIILSRGSIHVVLVKEDGYPHQVSILSPVR